MTTTTETETPRPDDPVLWETAVAHAIAEKQQRSGPGRPRQCPDEVLARVVKLRARGTRLVAIADQLNEDRVPTPAGLPCWNFRHVWQLLRTQDARQVWTTALGEVVAASR
jgi:hypothetical protein